MVGIGGWRAHAVPGIGEDVLTEWSTAMCKHLDYHSVGFMITPGGASRVMVVTPVMPVVPVMPMVPAMAMVSVMPAVPAEARW